MVWRPIFALQLVRLSLIPLDIGPQMKQYKLKDMYYGHRTHGRWG